MTFRRPGFSAILLLVIVAVSACGRQITEPVPPRPVPDPLGSVVPPAPSLEVSPPPSQEAETAAIPYFAVGLTGMDGPWSINTGTSFFWLTNQDSRPHAFDLVRLEGSQGEADVAEAVRHGDWPTGWVEVLERSGKLSQAETAEVRPRPLPPGSYMLVDTALDPKTAKPFGRSEDFLWAFDVVDPP